MEYYIARTLEAMMAGQKMDICVLGDGPLAEAIRFGVTQHFNLVNPMRANVVWVAWDTPALAPDYEPDTDFVLMKLRDVLRSLNDATIVISSQLPVGTADRLAQRHQNLTFVVVPENIRSAHNIQDWLVQERIVVGLNENDDEAGWTRELMTRLLMPFTDEILFMSRSSAEVTKHALNGFLALSVSYINEIAGLCELVGATATDVAEGLLSDLRIGSRAYLHPGGPYSTHLQREIVNLQRFAPDPDEFPIIHAIAASNAVIRKEQP